jgi:hypothetical protein
MRVGAVNLLVGGGWFSAGDIWPGLRKRGGVVGLPCSVGCNRSLAEFAAIAVGGGVCGAGVGGVCAGAGSGHTPSIAATATPATIGARRRCLPGGGLAPRARTSVTVRVTSRAAKADHRLEPQRGARSFPVRQPRDTGTGRRAGPDG